MTSQANAFTAVPVNQFLGFELKSRDPGSAVVSFRPDRVHTQEYGVVHGGILSTLADTAAVYTIQPMLADGERMTSIEFKINFLAAAVADRGEVVARATLIRKGRTVAIAQVDVHQGDSHVAIGLFTYIVMRAATPAA